MYERECPAEARKAGINDALSLRFVPQRLHRLRKNLFPHLLCIRARVYACRKCFQLTWASAPELKKHEQQDFSAASSAAKNTQQPEKAQSSGFCFRDLRHIQLTF